MGVKMSEMFIVFDEFESTYEDAGIRETLEKAKQTAKANHLATNRTQVIYKLVPVLRSYRGNISFEAIGQKDD